MLYSGYVNRLVSELAALPGIGEKSAQRLAFYMINMPPEKVKRLADTMIEARSRVKYCSGCFTLTDTENLNFYLYGYDEPVTEVILATNSSIEGETTAMYISKLIKPLGVKVTRTASGVPVGGDLEYIDEITLTRALDGRTEV